MTEESVYARHRRHTGAVLVIGVGAVGSRLAEELARLGISPLGLIDLNVLKTENIVRHALGEPYIGQPKAPGLADQIRRDFPLCEVAGVQGDFLELPEADQLRLVREVDLVVAATDSPACQQRINEICVQAQVTAVYPGIWTGAGAGDHDAEVGEVLWVPGSGRTPCYLCATSWRTGDTGAQARGGTGADIMVLVLATASVVDALLEPDGQRAGLLNEEETLILVHGFMPASAQFQDFFDGRTMRSVEVPFPPEPCPACGRSQPPTPSPPPSPPVAAHVERQRPFRTSSVWASGILAALLVAGLAILITQHNAGKARAAAGYAASGAALERAARHATVDCYVALDDGSGGPGDNARFPCTAIPLQRATHYAGDSYWTVITVKGVPYLAAEHHNISLYCRQGEEGSNSNSLIWLQPGADLRIFLPGLAGTKDFLPKPVVCEIYANSDATIIRTIRIAMVLDPRQGFHL